MELPKKLDQKAIEKKWQEYWEKHKTYAFDPNDIKRKLFSIDTPPPTVSGKMHMGHAFGNSQQDFIARYKRMSGFNVLQPFGTDDNGLPTKLLVEREKKVKASHMGRKKFVKLVLDTLEKELRPKYISDWKKLGISCDFDVVYTTINDHCRKISQKSFIDLYKAGREYRAEAPAMYCPKCCTAISQVECEDAEINSHFNDVVFKVDNKDLIIATTRPELLPACVAVFVHPDDKKNKKLVGKKATVPLFNFEVPILKDERVDPEKGTGIVMCCTFGDTIDTEWQRAFKLPIKEVIGRDGKMTSLAKGYEGLSIEDARKKIINDLKKENLLKSQKEIKHAVNVHERCGTPIEFIHSKQWFIKYLDMKKDMIKWGNELNWFPKHMKNRYENWVKGLQWDWLISRQLPFGIPFPVWYCEACEEIIIAKEKDLPVDPTLDNPPVTKCPKCGCNKFIPEEDIINTWATSSLTPTIVKELFKGKPVYSKLVKNPMDFRPQGHDIITFWLFNTVVKSQLHYNMNPWKDCFINGWMLDPKGKKMSKSKSNIIEPQDMVDKYSADALRFMAGGSKLGEDFSFPEKELVAGQKTTIKLFNSAKFVFMHLEDYDGKKPVKLEVMDQWLLIGLNKLIKECTDGFERYEFSQARLATEKFFWHTFCDSYLEIVKDRLYNPNRRGKASRLSAQYTLHMALDVILKLFAPIIPHITEEIYSWNHKESIHISEWPKPIKFKENKEIVQIGDIFIEAMTKVRAEKTKEGKSLKERIRKLSCDKKLEKTKDDLKAVTSSDNIIFGKTFKVEF